MSINIKRHIMMKQSVDLMNSMKLMNSRHSNTTTTTTSLARRALLLLTMLVMSLGSAWGQTLTKGTPAKTLEQDLVITENKFTISGADFKSLIGAYPQYVRFTAYDSSNTPIAITSVSSESRTYKSFGESGYIYTGGYQQVVWSDGGIVTVTLASGTTKLECYILSSGQYYSGTGDFTEADGGTLITYTIPVPFEGSAKSGSVSGTDITKYLTEETQLTLDVTKATAKLGGTAAKYARFYVLHNGVAENLKTNTTLVGGFRCFSRQTISK